MNTVDNLIAKRFRPIVEKAHHLAKWQECLEDVLEPELRTHVKVANVIDECLVLQVDSPNWATRIRLMTPQILANLIPPGGLSVNGIKCIVRPDTNALRPKSRHIIRHLPKQARSLLRMTADSIQNPELKRALEKLSEK